MSETDYSTTLIVLEDRVDLPNLRLRPIQEIIGPCQQAAFVGYLSVLQGLRLKDQEKCRVVYGWTEKESLGSIPVFLTNIDFSGDYKLELFELTQMLLSSPLSRFVANKTYFISALNGANPELYVYEKQEYYTPKTFNYSELLQELENESKTKLERICYS